MCERGSVQHPLLCFLVCLYGPFIKHAIVRIAFGVRIWENEWKAWKQRKRTMQTVPPVIFKCNLWCGAQVTTCYHLKWLKSNYHVQFTWVREPNSWRYQCFLEALMIRFEWHNRVTCTGGASGWREANRGRQQIELVSSCRLLQGRVTWLYDEEWLDYVFHMKLDQSPGMGGLEYPSPYATAGRKRRPKGAMAKVPWVCLIRRCWSTCSTKERHGTL
jgi:hypothetical protein